MPNRQIKFIWDFYGEDAKEIAQHHARHLVTFFELNKLKSTEINSELITDGKSIAYVICEESNVQIIKNSLRPHRATIEP